MDHVTRENILAIIEGEGHRMARMAEPNYWRHEDHDRAKPYTARRDWCRWAYTMIRKGHSPALVVHRLAKFLGPDGNGIRLLERAIAGDYATTGEQLVRGGHGMWVTYGGDFYCVERGDALNTAAVARIANANLPAEKRVVEGAEIIAAMVPNPCVRVPGATQAR